MVATLKPILLMTSKLKLPSW